MTLPASRAGVRANDAEWIAEDLIAIRVDLECGVDIIRIDLDDL